MPLRTYDKLIATIFHRQGAVQGRRARFGASTSAIMALPGHNG